MLHQYHMKNNTEFAQTDIGNVSSLTPSESGSDPGEKSDDSGYKSSFGRSRSESHFTNPKFKMSRSRTWQDNIEYKRTDVNSVQCELNHSKNLIFDKIPPCGDESDDSDMHSDCQETQWKGSSNPDRKTSIQNVKQVKSYIFNSVRTFVICLSLLQLFQVMGSGYSKSALTSIERRYRLSTFKIGFLQSCFHFGNLSVILFVSYYGSRWHRPRTIAIGSLLMAVSSFLSATPQFVGSRYNPNQDRVMLTSQADILYTLANTSTTTTSPNPQYGMQTSNENLCRNYDDVEFQKANAILNVAVGMKASRISAYESSTDHTITNTEAKSGEYWDDSNLYLFIALGSVLKGMGHSPLHPLGMSFIDDYATPRNSAVYIGIVSGLSLLGPAFGFILGSLTTRTWVDWGWIERVKINPHSPMWVGAWWMGYLVTGVLLLIATIPLYLFPRKIEKEKDEEIHKVSFCRIFQNCCSTNQNRLDETDQSEKEPLERNADDFSLHEIVIEDDHCDVKFRDRQRKDAMLNGKSRLNKPDKRNSDISYDFPISGESKKAMDSGIGARCSVEIHFDDTANTFVSSSCSAKPIKSTAIKDSSTLSNDVSPIKMDVAAQRRQSYGPSKDNIRRRPSRLEKLALIDFTASFKGLLTDSVFLSITFGLVCLTSFLAASVTYVSKYMETQFSITASFANLLNGSVNLPMVVVGNLLGGWLIRRFDLNVRHTMFVVLAGISMTSVSVLALLLFKCQASTENYSSGTGSGNCSLECDCVGMYLPVCDSLTNTTYKSPCDAGCRRVVMDGLTKKYTDCRCLSSYWNASHSVSSRIEPGRSYSVVPGPCNLPDCSQSHLPVFLGVMGAASLTAGIASTPSSLLILRIVPPAEKAFAIGIVFVFTRILAWIPAPVYVGYIIDSACLRWSAFKGVSEINEAERNHCEMYDKDRLRSHFFAATGGLLLLSLLFYTLAVFRHAKRVNNERVGKRTNSDIRRIISYSNSPNFSRDSSPSDTLVSSNRSSSVSRHSVKCARTRDEFNRLEDRKFSEYLEEKQLMLSTALEKPFKIAISLSAPVLANQTDDDGRFCMAPPSFDNQETQQVTDV